MIQVVLTALFIAGTSIPIRSNPDNEAAPRQVPKVEHVNQGITGFVKEVTKDSITIESGRGGQPRRFAVSDILASGDFWRSVTPPSRYKLSDIRVGDQVNIDYDRIDGRDICWAVGIRRRPGGKIPPGHYPADARYQPHEQAQALQDLEEKSIPLPEKYLSPEEREERAARIAPPPREAVPPIPPAAP